MTNNFPPDLINRIETIIKDRNDRIIQGATQRDKALLTLSSAAIGLGLTLNNSNTMSVFIKTHHSLFVAAMACFLVCILTVLFSYFPAEKMNEHQIDAVDQFNGHTVEKRNHLVKKAGWCDKLVRISNYLSALSFAAGAICLFFTFI